MKILKTICISAVLSGVGAVQGHAQGDCEIDDIRIGICDPDRELNRKPVEEARLSDAELAALPRDERRTKILEGFTCNRFVNGQLGYVKYLTNGEGRFGHQEGYVSFTWSIEDDRICYRSPNFSDSCDALPARNLPKERDWLIGEFAKNCH